MRPRLWLAPLAVDRPAPISCATHARDMLILDRDGSAQNVSWWNAFTMCPAYPPTVDLFRAQVRRIIGEWGVRGAQARRPAPLNGVAPCHNPAQQPRPAGGIVREAAEFPERPFTTRRWAINPQAIIEICPCGDSFAFHNIPAMNNTPASDPLPAADPLEGQDVQGADGSVGALFRRLACRTERRWGDDFRPPPAASARSHRTKFTWPEDSRLTRPTSRPAGSVLTAQKEALGQMDRSVPRQYAACKSSLLGGLYDIGSRRGRRRIRSIGKAMLHYTFSPIHGTARLVLRGLGAGKLHSHLTAGRALHAIGARIGPGEAYASVDHGRGAAAKIGT